MEHVWRLLERNVRVPNQVLGDLRAQLAAGHVGARGLLALADEHGPRRLADLGAAVLDYAADRARLAIREIPDGVYGFTDYLDDDGIDPEPIPIQVTLHVAGDRITVDFTGSGRQVRGAINCPLPFTKSAAYACVRCVMPTDIPNNEGHFRPIEVTAPEGTIVNPHRPAPVAARGLTGFRIANAVLGALAQAVPERVPAAEAGGDTGRQPGGLRRAGRAVRAAGVSVRIVGWPPVRRRPGRGIERGGELRQQSGGGHRGRASDCHRPVRVRAGQRGRRAVPRGAWRSSGITAMLAEQTTLNLRSDRRTRGPYGLKGGQPGATSQQRPGAGRTSGASWRGRGPRRCGGATCSSTGRRVAAGGVRRSSARRRRVNGDRRAGKVTS